ncbi:MAG: DinB family protein [Mycobacterium leprae]
MTFTVHIDGFGKGIWMGHLLSEPGCIWLAANPSAVTATATAAIARHFDWLRANGEPGVPLLSPDQIEIYVSEIQEVPNFGQSGAAVGLFEPDLLPVTDNDIATVVRRLGYARRNLLETIAEVPAEALDWQPPSGKRTLRQNLQHIQNCQGWYLTRVLGWETVEQILPDPWPADTLVSLNWVMSRTVGTLLNLPEQFRSGIYEAEEPAEQWTARKMLRRCVEHELEHLGVIRATIALWSRAEQSTRP